MKTWTNSSKTEIFPEALKVHQQITTAKNIAYTLIYNCFATRVRLDTKTFAIDICDYACGYFSYEWHCSNFREKKWQPNPRLAKRLGHSELSLLCEAYQPVRNSNVDSIFQQDALLLCTKAAACASIILATILCNDSVVDEEMLCKKLSIDISEFDQFANTIRRYGYCIFAVVCDGCVTKIPSVQREFVKAEIAARGPRNQDVAKVFSHQSSVQLLCTVKQCRELQHRYNTMWIGKAHSVLSKLLCGESVTKQQFVLQTGSLGKKRAWLACIFDCFLIWLSLCNSDLKEQVGQKLAKLFARCQNKKRTLDDEPKPRRLNWIDKLCAEATNDTWVSAANNWIFKRHLFGVKIKTMLRTVTNNIQTVNRKNVLTCSTNELNQLLVEPNAQSGRRNLGSGSYGNVTRTYLVEAFSDGDCRVYNDRQCAVKSFNSAVENGQWLNDISDSLQEINALLHFKNEPHVVQCQLAILASDAQYKYVKNISMCMPLYQNDLYTFLKTQKRYNFCWSSLNRFCKLASQIANGLHVLHKNGFMHRDIKSGNMLISDDLTHMVLADFGSAVYLYPTSQNTQSNGETSTLWWRCPEHILQQTQQPSSIRKQYKTSTAADVWSLGICIAEMVTVKNPFSTCHSEDEVVQLQKQYCLRFAEPNDLFAERVKKHCKMVVSKKQTKLNLYQQILATLKKTSETLWSAKIIADYMFQHVLYLEPTRRDSAKSIADFFSNLKQETVNETRD